MKTDYELLQTGLAGVTTWNTIKVEFKGIAKKKKQIQGIGKGRKETKYQNKNTLKA